MIVTISSIVFRFTRAIGIKQLQSAHRTWVHLGETYNKFLKSIKILIIENSKRFLDVLGEADEELKIMNKL